MPATMLAALDESKASEKETLASLLKWLYP
jgi:hypothetical protein